MTEDIICPYCGCKGKKTPHERVLPLDESKKYGWNDVKCASCRRAFRSYRRGG